MNSQRVLIFALLVGATVCLLLCTALFFEAATKTGEVMSKPPFMLAGFTTLAAALTAIILLVEIRLSNKDSTVQGRKIMVLSNLSTQ